MGAHRFEVMIVNAKTKKHTTREWRTSELVKNISWLKRMNARGGDIFIKPLDGPELMLIDELDAPALERIRSKGLAPAVAIETAPGRFQAWVKLSDHPLPEQLRRAAITGLSRVLPIVGEHGRLAGFTNRKWEANGEGRHLYVLVREVAGKVAPTARLYLDAIEHLIREHAAERQRQIQEEQERLVQGERHRIVEAQKATHAPRHSRGRSR